MNIITPSDTSLFVVAQKVKFYVEHIEDVDVTWSLSETETILEDTISIIENDELVTINEIIYDYCLIKFKSSGNFILKTTNTNNDTDVFNTYIYGLDTNWVVKQTKLWSSDVGKLCNGINESIQHINKWSLFKPIRNSALSFDESDHWLNSDRFRQNGAGMYVDIWSGDLDNRSLLYFLNNSITTSWNYLEPRGLDYNEYYRLTDYLGYTKEKNNSELILNTDYSRYNIGLSNIITRENWDSYTLENKNNDQILKFSDIQLDSETNLGEYFLAVYVINGDKHYIRILTKLSDQDISSFIINIPYEDLYKNDEHYFGVKDELIKYYFAVSNSEVSDDWIEITDKHNDKFPIEYAPKSVSWKYKYLLKYFKNAVILPLTTIQINKNQNKTILSTELRLIIKNLYTFKRNIFLNVVQKDNLIPYKFNTVLSESENINITLEGITSQDEGKLIFYNCFNSDAIYWDINNTSEYNGWFRPTLNNKNTIEIKFNEILSSISELQWNSLQNKIVLVSEDINIEFNNSNSSNQDILVRLDKIKSNKLTLSPNTSGNIINILGNIYSFKNLEEYEFKIYTPNYDINLLNSYNIDYNEDIRIVNFQSEVDTDCIIFRFTIDIGNTEYNSETNPLTINITVIS